MVLIPSGNGPSRCYAYAVMRKNISVLFGMVVVGWLWASPVYAVDPVAHWKFDEGTGTTATDASGNNRDGTISGAAFSTTTPPDVEFEDPYSLEFDGVDDGVTTPLSLNNSSEFTLAGWAYPRSASDSEGWFGANDVFEFIFNDATTLRCWTSAGAVNWSFEGDADFLNNWHHITCLGDGDHIIMYVDGEQVASTTHTHTDDYGTGDNVSIGLGVQSPGAGPFDGFIDDVRVYDVALTPAEMLSLGTGSEEPLNNPVVTDMSPENNDTDVSIYADLSLTFNMDVAWSTGDIVIKKMSDDSVVETIAADGDQVSGSESDTLVIDPSSNLEYDTEYYVEIASTAVESIDEGLFFAGITGASTWSFTTTAAPDPAPEVTTELTDSNWENLYDAYTVNGASWTAVAASTDGQTVAALGANTESGNNGYVYISRDAGETWNSALAIPDVVLTSIDMSPDGQSIFAIGIDLFNSDGSAIVLFRSADSGNTWDQQSAILIDDVLGFEIDSLEMLYTALLFARIEASDDLSHLYLNLFNLVLRSEDQGETWEVALELEDVDAFLSGVSTSASGTVAVLNTVGLFGGTGITLFTSNGGDDWNIGVVEDEVSWFTSLISSDSSRFVLTPVNGDLYVVTEADGIVTVPHPNGESWFYVKMISADGMDMIASSMSGDGLNPTVSIYASTDGGYSWEWQASVDMVATGGYADVLLGSLVSSSDFSRIGMATLMELYIFDEKEFVELPDQPTRSNATKRQKRAIRDTNQSDSSVASQIAELEQQLAALIAQYERVYGNMEIPGSVRDLETGMVGEDVRALQTLLIALNTGPHAAALALLGATGNFGIYTKNALIEYQTAQGITPAIGYFGSITRAVMKASELAGV